MSIVSCEQLLDVFIKKNRVPHLILLSGRDISSLRSIAFSFAQKWLSAVSKKGMKFYDTHPDIHHITPEGKLGVHSIASMRLCIETIAYAPFQAAGKVVILESAERMPPISANALLKTLEEPVGNTVILLLTTKEELLLPTVRSRCVKIFCNQESDNRSQEQYDTIIERLVAVTQFSDVCELAREYAQQFEKKRDAIEEEVRAVHQASSKEMSSLQKQRLESEIEGVVAARWFEEITQFLEMICELFRDRHIFFHGASSSYLLSSERACTLPLISLHRVQDAVSIARLSLERSTPVVNVLETLLYSLLLQ